jgi:hypothetical protein
MKDLILAAFNMQELLVYLDVVDNNMMVIVKINTCYISKARAD